MFQQAEKLGQGLVPEVPGLEGTPPLVSRLLRVMRGAWT